ncbi:(+)-delta-cadinene synthase isozyme A [Hibiscus syriacus]|uniref:(+)-delta-cadinene synthase isozyme A n=1 Tax=Hibiscus syriacus TaxID=106335 RepID=A0A6A2YHR0_HIBSY|nr:(+)-delta-cadinene synthase isozyme A [Hibiscus syriacus]
MSSQVSANLVPSQAVNMSKENRHLADYIPNFWGEIFLSSPSDMDMDAGTQQEYQELKRQVRRMLVKSIDKPSRKVHIIDAVQRLGVAYHFKKEIEDALQIVYQTDDDDDDLCTTAVRFRLLREHGFNVHHDENGKFKESLISDIKGMLEFYEAAHFQLQGESILEEALSFTTFHLKLAETMVDYPLSLQIAGALKRPLRKSLPRLVARSYISIYEGYGNQDQNLMKFAKLDFKMVQHLHKQELKEINRWWKDLDVATNFPYIRDRLVECYLCINGVYFEPHYSIARTFMTKVISLTSIMDDTYDAYGTPEELELFTKAIHRWDINCTDQLPDYMKLLYREILNVFKDMNDLMSEQGKSYRVPLAIEAMKQACQAQYTEAKWLHEKYMPTLVEYLSVAFVSSCYPMLTIVSFVGMEDSIRKETFIWAFNDPKILRASTTICRLMDDVVSHQFEQVRGHSPYAVECYINQYGTSAQVAYDEFYKRINNAWKDLNEELLKPTAVPKLALDRVLNLTRVIDLLYKDEDAYTRVGESAKTGITMLLIDPISI